MSTASERRRHARFAVNQPATIVLDGGLTRVDGTVVNVSQSGAKVTFAQPDTMPEDFYMLMEGHRLQPCRMVWRNAEGVGVRFI